MLCTVAAVIILLRKIIIFGYLRNFFEAYQQKNCICCFWSLNLSFSFTFAHFIRISFVFLNLAWKSIVHQLSCLICHTHLSLKGMSEIPELKHSGSRNNIWTPRKENILRDIIINTHLKVWKSCSHLIPVKNPSQVLTCWGWERVKKDFWHCMDLF